MGDQAFPWLADFTRAAGAIPVWAAGALAALIAVLLFLTMTRPGPDGWSAAVGRIVIAGIAAASIIPLLIQNGIREHADARRSLEARVSEITVRAMLPGSPLGCLSIDPGSAVNAACEKAVFANATTVSAAVVYVGARIAVLQDARRLERQDDLAGMASMADLRRSLERDPFGIASHVLAFEYGCTAERCDAFGLFSDTDVLKVNLKGRVFEAYVKRYADDWKETAAAVAKAPEADKPAETANAPQASGQPAAMPGRVPTTFDFPSAASIPPVSIMNPEPPRPNVATPETGAAGGERPGSPATPVPPSRPPAQAGEPSPRQ
ncbi:MAG: hypothetical protein AB7O50_14365 [Pseudolabrys sp.]